MTTELCKFPVYAPFEVIVHNTPEDCWLSFLGKVYNLTPLIKRYKNDKCIKPLLAFAGKDVSHWFDENTGEIQHFAHPVTGVEVPYCPHGKLPEVPYDVPTVLWEPVDEHSWWKSEKYQVGVLTKQVRPLRIVNMLILKEVTINVCCEDSFNRIAERYSAFNSKASDSYIWVYKDRKIDMDKTMDENGILDEREKMADLGIPKSYYTPLVRLYYRDNLDDYEDLSEEDNNDDPEICCLADKYKQKSTKRRSSMSLRKSIASTASIDKNTEDF